jgi:hypothetical protein
MEIRDIFSHKMLVDIGAKFLKGFGCGIVLKELVCLNETGISWTAHIC